MNAHSSELPSPMNEHGLPNTELSCAGVTALAWPVAVSPIHSSTPLSRWLVNAKRLPSALNPIQVMTGDGGLVEVQATAERTPLSRASLDDLLALAADGIAELRAAQEQAVAAAAAG